MKIYGAKWQAARVEFLELHKWCVFCLALGRREKATRVDHIIPHRGNLKLFWDRKNWQPLCETCHNGPKQSQEKSGFLRGADAEGNPLDPQHHWNKQ